jgi:hypothetical protein
VELYLIEFGLIGVLLVASVMLFAKVAVSGGGDALMIAGGNFLWLWTIGAFLLVILEIPKRLLGW